MTTRDYGLALRDEYLAEGRYVEAGWIEMCMCQVSEGMRPWDKAQYEALRTMWFAGATFMYSTMMIMGQDKPPKPESVTKVNLMGDELRTFAQETITANCTAGNA